MRSLNINHIDRVAHMHTIFAHRIVCGFAAWENARSAKTPSAAEGVLGVYDGVKVLEFTPRPTGPLHITRASTSSR
jgi:hypothetical protein